MARSSRSPFGPLAAESESRSADSDDLYFRETSIVQAALQPSTYLIVGRRGTGKSALADYLVRKYRKRGAIAIEASEVEMYPEVFRYVAERPGSERELIVARLKMVWHLALWRIVFRRLREKGAEIAAADDLLSHAPDMKSWFTRILTPTRSRLQVEDLLADERLERAKESVLAMAARLPILVTIDSREQYDVANEPLINAVAALIMYASDFQAAYGPRGMHLKLFVSGELYPHLTESVLLNPLKTIREPLHLLWQPRDLLRMISWRLHRYLVSLPDYRSSVRIDWSDPEDVLDKVWRPSFGRELTNENGLQERTFTYVLRHTQLRPRQLISLCNAIAGRALERDGFPPASSDDIRSAVDRGTTLLAQDVVNSHSRVSEGDVRTMIDVLSGVPATFPVSDIDRLFGRSRQQSGQTLVEMGVIGRVHERHPSEHSISADFQYSRPDRMFLSRNDECVVHPMFHGRLNIVTRSTDPIIPFPSDVDREGAGAEPRVYYRQVRSFMGLPRRAESGQPETLVQTFVNIGPLMTLLSTRDHQIVYGRRGTGKTHALRYLAETAGKSGDVAVYIDVRQIGSTGGIYGDAEIPLAERATRLLKDVLGAVHDALYQHIVARTELDLQELGPALDRLAEAITEVVVSGTVQTDHSVSAKDSSTVREGAKIKIAGSPEAGLEHETARARSAEESQRIVRSGVARNRVHFGRVGSAVRDLAAALAPRRLWILLDEWSVVPADLQPLLADLIRRSLFPINGVTVKIGAIEQRTHLQIRGTGGDYVGIELGADAAADVNLDDFLVYEHNPDRATNFFLELLFRHVCALEDDQRQPRSFESAEELHRAFTRRSAFEELVRAAEGVPRDAINILSLAAQRAGDSAITVEDVRTAAKTWYQRDKEAAASADGQAHRLLTWIVDEVIGQRRTRGFLLRSDERHPLIDSLFDSRVLHILKRDIRAAEQPGVRYHAYKIDYGCYVDLLTTPRGPRGLFAGDEQQQDEFVDVPPDDDRAIRRAVLDLRTFETSAAH